MLSTMARRSSRPLILAPAFRVSSKSTLAAEGTSQMRPPPTTGPFALFDRQVALSRAATVRSKALVLAEAAVSAPLNEKAKAASAADPWHCFSPAALAAVNTVGNLCALAAAASHDHIILRLLAGSSSSLVVAFNVLMPKPLKTHQKTAAAWGMMFAVLHFVNLGLLIRESQGINLSEEEEDIYEHGFQKFGVTPRQFRMLLNAGAKFVDCAPGQVLAEAGTPVDRVIYVIHGSCVSERANLTVLEYHQDVFIGELQPSTWRAEYLGCPILLSKVAEEWKDDPSEDEWLIERTEAKAKRTGGRRSNMRKVLLEGLAEKTGMLTELKAGAAWQGKIRAGGEGCRLLVWPLGAFTCAAGADEKLCKSMERIDEMGLASKISAGSGRKALDGYKEMLKIVIADGIIDPDEKHALHRYRARHAVPDTEHSRMIEELGWSAAEYEDGILNKKFASRVKR